MGSSAIMPLPNHINDEFGTLRVTGIILDMLAVQSSSGGSIFKGPLTPPPPPPPNTHTHTHTHTHTQGGHV